MSKYQYESGIIVKPSGKPLDDLCFECGDEMRMGNLTKCRKIICWNCRTELDDEE